MTDATERIRTKAADIVCNLVSGDYYTDENTSAVEAALLEARDEAIEEAARVAHKAVERDAYARQIDCAKLVAAAVRSLKSKGAGK